MSIEEQLRGYMRWLQRRWLLAAVLLSRCLAGMMAAAMAGRYWFVRLPWVSSLPSGRGERVDAQAERSACLALGCPPLTQSERVEVIGNPAAQRYPDCKHSLRKRASRRKVPARRG